MTNEGPGAQTASAQGVAEKRRYSRHQLIGRVYVTKKDGAREAATSFEISAGGMSAATTAKLKIGEEVTLSPVAGEHVAATVRRCQGTMYGFEFTAVSEQLREKILQQCQTLPLFRSLANI
jgi:c-di-GMP-binding flagellar brake protein YcgR